MVNQFRSAAENRKNTQNAKNVTLCDSVTLSGTSKISLVLRLKALITSPLRPRP